MLHLAFPALPFFVTLYIIESRDKSHYTASAFPPRVSGKHRSRTRLFKEVRSLLSRTFSGFVLARVGFFLPVQRSLPSLRFSLSRSAVSAPERKMPAASKAKAFQRGGGGGGGGNNARAHPYPPPQHHHQQLPPPPPQQQQQQQLQQGNAPSGGGARTTRERSNSSAASDSNAGPNAKRHLSCEKCVHTLFRKRENPPSTISSKSAELTDRMMCPRPTNAQLSIAQDALLAPESVPLLPHARRHVQLDRDSPRWDRRRGRVEVDQRRDREVEETGRFVA